MNTAKQSASLIKKLFALSRTQHIVIDIAAPAVCALIVLGYIPSISVVVIGLITAFAGYNAIYALNDIVGRHLDQKKMMGTTDHIGYSVESSELRHPLAQGELSLTSAITWVATCGLVALLGAYWLNPIAAAILILGGLLETIYCLLIKVSHWRVIISAIVKACGPVAAILAVTSEPPLPLLIGLTTWVMLWEVGGQNIPADWTDIDEDKRADSRTTPIRYGSNTTRKIIVASLALTLLTLLISVLNSPMAYSTLTAILTIVPGALLLTIPGHRLFRNPQPRQAAQLFSVASFYPLSIFLIVGAVIVLHSLLSLLL